MLTLHHDWLSTCSQKVRLCLEEKQLDWRGEILKLHELEHLQEAFLALNPAGMVPVLEHDGLVITESTIINEYLEDAFGQVALMPRDAPGRARVRAWTRYIDDGPSDAIKVPSYQRNLASRIRALAPDALEQVRTKMPNRRTAQRWLRIASDENGLSTEDLTDALNTLSETLEHMTSALERTRWLAGDHYTLADVNMVPFIERLARFDEFDLPRNWPAVQDWLNAIRARPAHASARFPNQGAA